MRFMMLMYPGIDTDAESWEPSAEDVGAMTKYNEELSKAGVLLSLDGLRPPGDGARVSFSGGTPSVTDGPFAEAKEVVGGYWLIQAASKEEAVEWASRCPGADGDFIEVRRVYEMEDFPRGRAGGGAALGEAARADVSRSAETGRAIEAVWRIESPRMIAGLARMTGDIGLAEDLAQDALVAALERWPESGVPENPGAWLTATAKNRAVDLARRGKRFEDRREQLAREAGMRMAMDAAEHEAALTGLGDDLLAKLGRAAEARAEFERAAAMTENARERELLLARAAGSGDRAS